LTKPTAYTITPAKDGGFTVCEYGYPNAVLFAGALDDVLLYVRGRLEGMPHGVPMDDTEGVRRLLRRAAAVHEPKA
jgi:hypothetical protein